MQENVVQYKCDNCRREVYTERSSVPVGWRRVKVWDEGNESEPGDAEDFCDSCAAAILSAIGKRKSIERGGFNEPPMQEHFKSPEACDAQAKIIAARMA